MEHRSAALPSKSEQDQGVQRAQGACRLRVQREALVERLREIYRTQDEDPLLGLLREGSLAELAGA